jgi:hypothetical protein
MRSTAMPPSGCATSLSPDTLHRATSTSGQLSMFEPTTSPAIPSAISSPASAAGRSPCASPDGATTANAGPVPVHVSRFRAQGSGVAMPTNDTSGPLFTASSPIASLQWSLANRLRQRMGANGSPLFALTWRELDMPLGPPICQLAASARRTSGSDCGSWQTPTVVDAKGRGYTYPSGNHDNPFLTLPGQAQLASWPTPGMPAQHGYNEAGNTDSGRKTVELCSWATPTASEKVRSEEFMAGRQLNAREALGPTSSGSPAPMGGRGQLNPAFSLWLQGYPTEWLSCAPQGIRSSRRLQRNS